MVKGDEESVWIPIGFHIARVQAHDGSEGLSLRGYAGKHREA
jgi:hypothetical protein